MRTSGSLGATFLALASACHGASETPPPRDAGSSRDATAADASVDTGAAQDASSDPEQRAADLVHQIRECRLVARARPLDEVSIHGSPTMGRSQGDRGLSSMRVWRAGIVQSRANTRGERLVVAPTTPT